MIMPHDQAMSLEERESIATGKTLDGLVAQMSSEYGPTDFQEGEEES